MKRAKNSKQKTGSEPVEKPQYSYEEMAAALASSLTATGVGTGYSMTGWAAPGAIIVSSGTTIPVPPARPIGMGAMVEALNDARNAATAAEKELAWMKKSLKKLQAERELDKQAAELMAPVIREPTDRIDFSAIYASIRAIMQRAEHVTRVEPREPPVRKSILRNSAQESVDPLDVFGPLDLIVKPGFVAVQNAITEYVERQAMGPITYTKGCGAVTTNAEAPEAEVGWGCTHHAEGMHYAAVSSVAQPEPNAIRYKWPIVEDEDDSQGCLARFPRNTPVAYDQNDSSTYWVCNEHAGGYHIATLSNGKVVGRWPHVPCADCGKVIDRVDPTGRPALTKWCKLCKATKRITKAKTFPAQA